MNFIHIEGNLGDDPKVGLTATGKKVTTLRVATRSRRGKNEETIWWRVTVWGDQFEKMISHLKKGSGIVVFGEVHKPTIYADREGKSQVSLDMTAYYLQFPSFGKPSGGGGQQPGEQASPAVQEGAPNPYMTFAGKPAGAPQGETFDDEVPF